MRFTSGFTWGIIGAGSLVVAAAWLLRPVTVEVDGHVVRAGPLRATLDESGRTRMGRHREVVAPVSGQLAESRVRVGDRVQAGDVVAELRPAPLDPRALAEATAAARAAEAVLAEAEATAKGAQLARDEARREVQRTQRLAAAGGVAARALEVALSADSANERQLEGARARVRAAAQEVQRARVALRPPGAPGQLVRLRAPIDGVVLRLFQEHERVLPAGTTLLEIGDPGSVELVIDVLSRDAASIVTGAPVLVARPGGDSLRGRVQRVEPAAFTRVSPLGIEEQRVPVVVTLEPGGAALGDRFELTASIVLWEAQGVLSVPPTALVPAESGWGVWVVREGRARRQPLETGRSSAHAVEVTRGLAPGDTVILLPEGRVAEGGRVRVNRGQPAVRRP